MPVHTWPQATDCPNVVWIAFETATSSQKITLLKVMTTPWPLWLHLKAVIALQPLWPAITTWKLFVGSVVQLSGWLSNEIVQVLNRILAPKVQKSSAMVGVAPATMRVMTLAREVGRII